MQKNLFYFNRTECYNIISLEGTTQATLPCTWQRAIISLIPTDVWERRRMTVISFASEYNCHLTQNFYLFKREITLSVHKSVCVPSCVGNICLCMYTRVLERERELKIDCATLMFERVLYACMYHSPSIELNSSCSTCSVTLWRCKRWALKFVP